MDRHFCTHRLLAMLAMTALITACSGGSGSENRLNVDSEPNKGGGPIYSGPAPATDDVQLFKINLWDNLVADNRCGACHKQGGSGDGYFVRDDDINLAYTAVRRMVDLEIPGNSLMVSKVAGGHNCWESDPGACADIILGWINRWANAAGGVANVVTLTAPEFRPVQDSRNFPADAASTNFATTVWPLLQNHCARCHTEAASTAQMPFFASSNLSVAYAAAQSRIDLADADRVPPQRTRSRFIVRLRDESHNCWTNACGNDALQMEQAIRDFAGAIPVTEVDPALLTSGAVSLLGDGIVASSGGRIESDMIALYTFKPPSNSEVGEAITEVIDVGGVGSPANLRAYGSDVTWVGGWGARLGSGRLQGSARKLYERITLTGEYSVEAWLIPGNVVQDNSARIVAYSGGQLTGNNFALAQSTYNYDFLHRGSASDLQGMPAYSTTDEDQVLQASLQHVVLRYDPVNGRQIFVNGEKAALALDPQAGGNLASWDNSFALTLGQHAGGGNQWQGTIRLLAIHDRALSEGDIRSNYAVGVGEKFYLLFDLSRAGLVDMPEAFVVFEVEQYDSFGYLFKNPFFISLDEEARPSGPITIRGMRIGLNGRELALGQAYAKLDTAISNSSYSPEGQRLSSFGTIIPLENGPEQDQFFLSFDQIGGNYYARPAAPAPAPLVPSLASDKQARIGIRHFEEVNAALSAMTGIPTSNPAVAATFEQVRQQLPQQEDVDGFLPAHQMAVTQLAVRYCNALASNSAARNAYFPAFAAADWNSPAATVFGDPSRRNAIIGPILSRLAADETANLNSQPAPALVRTELENLMDRMTGATPAPSTVELVTAVCAAAMGSALMVVQ